MNFIDEIKWRGMLHDIMPGTDELLEKETVSAYVGIDPTADSLHIGHLVGIMLLKHFQRAGHIPITLIGGATGMIGDPSGKSKERNLLDEKTLKHNETSIKKQLKKFLDFNSESSNPAILVNNYNWMKGFSFLDFIRDIGKSITVNYMMAKDSVKKRMSSDSEGKEADGLSFTEFSYQLVQGYDFLHLFDNYNCKIQMGGSDQWGNITTGTELIKRKLSGKAYALTCPLITKSDGNKFGKTEKGNIWLDPKRTSPYEFFQFWINTSDSDAEKYIKIFTILDKNEIDKLVQKHNEAPHLRVLQKKLAEDITCSVHSREEYENAIEASQILFGKGTKETLKKLDESTFLSIFDGVPKYNVTKSDVEENIPILDFLVEKAKVFKSKGELRRLMKDNGLSINQTKEKNTSKNISNNDLINNKYILIRKGKKNYSLINVRSSTYL